MRGNNKILSFMCRKLLHAFFGCLLLHFQYTHTHINGAKGKTSSGSSQKIQFFFLLRCAPTVGCVWLLFWFFSPSLKCTFCFHGEKGFLVSIEGRGKQAFLFHFSFYFFFAVANFSASFYVCIFHSLLFVSTMEGKFVFIKICFDVFKR